MVVGLAKVLLDASNPKFQWGYLLTWQARLAGEDDRADVNIAALRRPCSASWAQAGTCAWPAAGPMTSRRAGRLRSRGAVMNAFVEPQYTIAHGDGKPGWDAFAGVNFQF